VYAAVNGGGSDSPRSTSSRMSFEVEDAAARVSPGLGLGNPVPNPGAGYGAAPVAGPGAPAALLLRGAPGGSGGAANGAAARSPRGGGAGEGAGALASLGGAAGGAAGGGAPPAGGGGRGPGRARGGCGRRGRGRRGEGSATHRQGQARPRGCALGQRQQSPAVARLGGRWHVDSSAAAEPSLLGYRECFLSSARARAGACAPQVTTSNPRPLSVEGTLPCSAALQANWAQHAEYNGAPGSHECSTRLSSRC